MDDLALLSNNDADWLPYLGSLEPCLAEICVKYRVELVVITFSAPHTSLECFETDFELLSFDTALTTWLAKAESREGKCQSAPKAADVNSARTNNDADETAASCIPQAASNVSAQELLPNFRKINAKSVQVSIERPEVAKKHNVVAVKSGSTLEESGSTRGFGNCFEVWVWSIACPSEWALDAFANTVGTQVVESFRARLEDAYADSQL